MDYLFTNTQKKVAAVVEDYEKDKNVKLSASKEEILADSLKRQEAAIEAVKETGILDQNVEIAIGQEANKYFDGEKTAEEVAKGLQSKINVMLSE